MEPLLFPPINNRRHSVQAEIIITPPKHSKATLQKFMPQKWQIQRPVYSESLPGMLLGKYFWLYHLHSTLIFQLPTPPTRKTYPTSKIDLKWVYHRSGGSILLHRRKFRKEGRELESKLISQQKKNKRITIKCIKGSIFYQYNFLKDYL